MSRLIEDELLSTSKNHSECISCNKYLCTGSICEFCNCTQYKCTNCNKALTIFDDPFCKCGACVPFNRRPWSQIRGIPSQDYVDTKVKYVYVDDNGFVLKNSNFKEYEDHQDTYNERPRKTRDRECYKCNKLGHKHYECRYCGICERDNCTKSSCICVLCKESGTNEGHSGGRCYYSPCPCGQGTKHIFKECPNRNAIRNQNKWASIVETQPYVVQEKIHKEHVMDTEPSMKAFDDYYNNYNDNTGALSWADYA